MVVDRERRVGEKKKKKKKKKKKGDLVERRVGLRRGGERMKEEERVRMAGAVFMLADVLMANRWGSAAAGGEKWERQDSVQDTPRARVNGRRILPQGTRRLIASVMMV